MPDFAPLPTPPYYAVIFTARLKQEADGYVQMSEKMAQLAARQPGYIGVEHSRDARGLGITVSYWQTEAALVHWKAEAEHLMAQQLGKARWYDHYTLRVAKVERAYEGPEGRD